MIGQGVVTILAQAIGNCVIEGVTRSLMIVPIRLSISLVSNISEPGRSWIASKIG